MNRLLALLCALVLIAAACGSDGESSDEDTSGDAPQRIVSLSPSGTEILFAVGAGEQVIAVDSFSYFPPEAPVTELSGFEPNVEAIAAFEPDLVVFDFDPGDLRAGLEAVGIPTLKLSTASTFDDIYTQIENVGAATGHIGDAAELVANMQTDIEAAVGNVDGAGATYYHEVDTTLYSATSGTFIGEVYALFGLENIADAADPDGESFGFPQLSAEYIVEADPDLIFLADTLYESQSLDTVAARPGWDALSAVGAGNVFELNDDIVSRWGPRVVDFVESIANALATAKVPAAS